MTFDDALLLEKNYRFATQAEGRQLLLANTEYYNSLKQVDIDWRMRRIVYEMSCSLCADNDIMNMLKLYKYCFYRITRFWDHPVHYSLSYDPLTDVTGDGYLTHACPER